MCLQMQKLSSFVTANFFFWHNHVRPQVSLLLGAAIGQMQRGRMQKGYTHPAGDIRGYFPVYRNGYEMVQFENLSLVTFGKF